MTLTVLTWNLKHGRAEPPAGRDLLEEFVAALTSWTWDLGLLQEVPPWWPELLGRRLGASCQLVLTSRNFGLPVRRAIATRWPDLIKSSGGGCNAILIRHGRVLEHRTQRLAWRPERRWLHAARLDHDVWVANVHLTAHDTPRALSEARRAAATALGWADGAPLIFGGDLNVPELSLDGFERAAGHDVDYVFVRGLAVAGEPSLLERGSLSDHVPLAVTVGSVGNS